MFRRLPKKEMSKGLASVFNLNSGVMLRQIAPFHPSPTSFGQVKPVKNILVFSGNKLSLLSKEDDSKPYRLTMEKSLKDKYYNQVKSVSHTPLYIQTLLLNATPTQKKVELQQILEKINIAKEAIDLPEEADAKIQFQILDKTAKFIQELLDLEALLDVHETRKKVIQFFETLTPEYKHNKKLAAKIQFHKLDEVQKTFSLEYKDTHMVFITPYEPRKQLIEKTYYEHIYASISLSIKEHIFHMEKVPQDIAGVDIVREVPQFLYPEIEDKSLVKDKSPEKETPVTQTFPAKTIFEEINDVFLKEHFAKAPEMLNNIETIMIYYRGDIYLWKKDSSGKDFQYIKNVKLDSPTDFKKVISSFQGEYKIDIMKNRLVIAGEPISEKDLAIKKEAHSFYESASIKDAENHLMYYVEYVPKDGNIKNQYIHKFVGGAELNQTYGLSVTKNRSLMFSDVMGDPKNLSGLLEENTSSSYAIKR